METANYRGMNILERMSRISMELMALSKDIRVETPDGGTYMAISDLAVTNAVKMAEEKWGVYSYPHDGVFTEQFVECVSRQGTPYSQHKVRYDVTYRFACIDRPEDGIDVPSCGVGIDPSDKASGKAMTYSRKYAYLQGYRIPTSELDGDRTASDQNLTSASPTVPQTKEEPPAPKKKAEVRNVAAPVPVPPAPVMEKKKEEEIKEEVLPFTVEESSPMSPAEEEMTKALLDDGEMTEAKARAFVIDSGMYKGKTLGEILTSDPSYIGFAVNKMRRTEKNLPVIRACEVLYQHIA